VTPVLDFFGSGGNFFDGSADVGHFCSDLLEVLRGADCVVADLLGAVGDLIGNRV